MTKTTFTFMAEGNAGEASDIAIAVFASSFEVLTALRNGSGNLELIGWHAEGKKIARLGEANAGTVSEVALVLIDRCAVTAVRSGSDALLLISWNAPLGLTSLTRLHDSGTDAGKASQIAMTALGRVLVTAMRDDSGNLLLITWSLNPDGSFTRLADSHPAGKPDQAGAVSLVTITPVNRTSVVTAVRNGSGNLELIQWAISTDGKTIKREGPGATAGAVGEIALTPGASGVITAVQDGSGNLLVIPWQILTGGVFVRQGDAGGGTASHIDIHAAGPAGTYVASMRRGTGDLELVAFTAVGGGDLVRTGDVGGAQGTDVTETHITSIDGEALTARRRANFLDVMTWTVASTPS